VNRPETSSGLSGGARGRGGNDEAARQRGPGAQGAVFGGLGVGALGHNCFFNDVELFGVGGHRCNHERAALITAFFCDH